MQALSPLHMLQFACQHYYQELLKEKEKTAHSLNYLEVARSFPAFHCFYVKIHAFYGVQMTEKSAK